MKVSELITIDDISNWKQGDIITISAGTGTGKSFFIKNTLYDYARKHDKRILMLIHRRNCVDQFLYEVEKDGKLDVISIKTYQSIEALYRGGVLYNLDSYDYLIVDEFHYSLSDSSFNSYTDISLAAILNQTNTIRIFMSATGNKMKYYMKESKHLGLDTIDYEIPINFNFIRKLEFFKSNDTLYTYMDQAIALNKKAIFFIDDTQTAYELHTRYKEHTLFNCSQSSGYYKYVDRDKINTMLKKERFEELVLITTSVMDSGCNIWDSKLNHIVLDIKNSDSLIQCIGRKRLKDKNDYIDVHIKAIYGQQLGGMESTIRNSLKQSVYLLNNGQQALAEKYGRIHDESNILHYVATEEGIEKEINKMIFFNAVANLTEIENIKNLGKYGYTKFISGILGNKQYSIYEEEKKINNLNDYLDSIVGKRLMKEDQSNLKEVFRKNGLDAKTLGINTLNGNLKDRKLKYMIVSKRTSEWVDGKTKSIRFWEIIKDIEN